MQRMRCPFVRVKGKRRPERVASQKVEASTVSLALARELIAGVVAGYVIEYGQEDLGKRKAADPADQGTGGCGEDHAGQFDPE